MGRTPRFSRTALLVLSMLTGCAANDFGFDSDSGGSRFKPSGTIGAYLTGRYAVQRSDMNTAAEQLEKAATESGVPEVANQAFLQR